MSRPLLTIAIPTYNRASLLDLCLGRILDQVQPYMEEVEVLVSNNAATDHTPEIAAGYQQRYPNLRYSENEQNGGPDFNIARCFELATAKYVWVFSDDDLLLPNALSRLLPLLRGQNLGIITLPTAFYRHSIHEHVFSGREPLTYTLYDDPARLAEETHFWLTYITGIITNKDSVQDAPTLYQYQRSFMIQLGWVMPALFGGLPSAKVSTPLILGRSLETLDFKLFHVFGASYPVVLEDLARQDVIPEAVKEKLIQLIITQYFPVYIQPTTSYTHGERPLRILGKTFWKRREFWTTLLPLFARRQVTRILSTVQHPVREKVRRLAARIYSRLSTLHHATQATALTERLAQLGPDSLLPEWHYIPHPEHVAIGRGLRALPGLLIRTHPARGGEIYSPTITIGDYVQLGANCVLDCCAGIYIGDWVLVGNQVTITDHEVTATTEVMTLPPAIRPIISRGPMRIASNVLIEDGVRIEAGVSIGEGAIIKAGAVVRDPVPAYAVVAGNPARVIFTQVM